MSKYCNECGKENDDDQIICVSCNKLCNAISSNDNEINITGKKIHYCKQCGKENDADSVICSSCHKLCYAVSNNNDDEINESMSENKSEGLTEYNTYSEKNNVNKKNIDTFKVTLIGLGILFILVIGIRISAEHSMNSQMEGSNDKVASENNPVSSVKSDNKVTTDKVTAAEEAASDLDAKIIALGDINTLMLDKANDVKAIRTAFEALTSDQKRLVTELEVLVSAEKKITDLRAAVDKAAAAKAEQERLVEVTYENPIHVTISNLNKSINNYTGYYVVFEGDIVYIKENLGAGQLILSNRYNDLVFVSYSKATNYEKGQHLVVRALVVGTASNFQQNGQSVTIPSVSCDYMTNGFYDATVNGNKIIKNDINIEYATDSSNNITCNYKNGDIIKIEKGHTIHLVCKTGSGERIMGGSDKVIQFLDKQTIETVNTGVSSIQIVPGYADWSKAVKINIIVE